MPFDPIARPLTAIEARVLGTLMEKARTVPDSYPLTLNLLVTGCNQKTTRDPVMNVGDAQAQEALDALKLLSLVHASGRPDSSVEVPRMAREALEEMRLSVRHLKAQRAPLTDVLADWRAETVARLTAAGIDVDWDAQLPERPRLLSARTSSQLTRVLREAVSNLIRHSDATHCRVLLNVSETELQLELEDNGRGMDQVAVAVSVGHGLGNIERRVRRLGGSHRFVVGALGGTMLLMRVPLEPHAALSVAET